MNEKNWGGKMKERILGVLLMTLFFLPGEGFGAKQETPLGFDKYLVYMGDGLYDPQSPHPEGVPGCAQMQCDGYYFQQEIMGRSAEEVMELEKMAIHFFKSRFGIDVMDPALEGRILYRIFMFDSRNNYRAYTVSREKVPSEGWMVQDGGWMLMILDPAGIPLGGEFEGVTAPLYSTMIFGEYKIIPDKKEPFVLKYRSSKPVVVNADGSMMFQCELISDQYGTGIAQGIADHRFNSDGRVKVNIRNVLTFPPLGFPTGVNGP